MLKYFIGILFALLIIADCIGDICFHKSIHDPKNHKPYLLIGLMLYLCMGFIYYEILKKYDNIAIPNALYQCFSILAVTFVSIVILKEKITNTKIIGIIVILIGLAIIQIQ